VEVTATTRYVRISGEKARGLARAIQGQSVSRALELLQFAERKAAFLIAKTLKSAVANAENNAKLAVEDLRVKEAAVMPGPTLRRMWPRARGMGSPIAKRTSHIRVILTDGREDGASGEGGD